MHCAFSHHCPFLTLVNGLKMADLFAKVICTYCEEEITGIIVQCCVCKEFDICLQCFSVGAEIGNHNNDHAYRFVEHWSGSRFGGKGNWTGGEELKLLESVEAYFGKWETVATHVKTRTAEEVEEMYISRYLDGNIGKVTWDCVREARPEIFDHVPEDNGPLSSTAISRLPPLDASPQEAQLLGYKPNRGDFEWEYDMDAELLVTPLQSEILKDTNVEKALKLSIVDMYTRRLRERAKRKRLVRDYQLVGKFFANQRKETNKRPLTKEQREIQEKTKVFSQFLTSAEHERLLTNLEREKELRLRLSELTRYRSLGLTTQEEVLHYEQHMTFQKQQQLKQGRSGSSGLPALAQEFALKNGKSEEQSFSEKKSMWDGGQDNCNYNNNNNNRLKMDSSLPPDALPFSWMMSQNELQLCKTYNLQPAQYMTLKSLIIQEHLSDKHKHVEINADSLSVKDAVTQYLSNCGWLPGVTLVYFNKRKPV